nr:reverse transcriptase domain, reverse transcriptase zinc-binding domain protein [Tanacetum cinerariifolium]
TNPKVTKMKDDDGALFRRISMKEATLMTREIQDDEIKKSIICLDDDTRSEINNIFPFKEGKLLVRYLRVPLVTKKIRVADCKQLVDKVNQKLSDWKNKSLSYARRAQLIASVLGSMQVYWGLSLSSLFSKNEIFYAGFKDHDKIEDVVGEDVIEPMYETVLRSFIAQIV